MSLGPCGDSMGFTLKGILSLSLIQAPVMMMLIVNRPAVKVDIYSSKVVTVIDPLTNHSVVDLKHPTELHYMHSVNVSSVFILCSACICLFALITYQISTNGIDGGGNIGYEEFVCTNQQLAVDPTISLWNNSFLALVVTTHMVVTAVLCSPCSMHFLLMVGLVLYTSFVTILQPKLQSHMDSGSAGSSAVNSVYMVAILFYVVGMTYVASNVSFDPGSYKMQLIFMLVFVDLFFLILGHTWDPSPLLKTIINCRLMYVVCMTFMVLTIYVLWDKNFRVPYINKGNVNNILE